VMGIDLYVELAILAIKSRNYLIHSVLHDGHIPT
jgi:hypothetical protein